MTSLHRAIFELKKNAKECYQEADSAFDAGENNGCLISWGESCDEGVKVLERAQKRKDRKKGM